MAASIGACISKETYRQACTLAAMKTAQTPLGRHVLQTRTDHTDQRVIQLPLGCCRCWPSTCAPDVYLQITPLSAAFYEFCGVKMISLGCRFLSLSGVDSQISTGEVSTAACEGEAQIIISFQNHRPLLYVRDAGREGGQMVPALVSASICG